MESAPGKLLWIDDGTAGSPCARKDSGTPAQRGPRKPRRVDFLYEENTGSGSLRELVPTAKAVFVAYVLFFSRVCALPNWPPRTGHDQGNSGNFKLRRMSRWPV